MSRDQPKQGLNESERYLSHLCKGTFLSMWSFTNVFRQPGSELCDLLVVSGNDIIIFSDKFCQYPDTGDENLNWNRWFKRAVIKSANQLWGAESWLKRTPERVFIDSKCEHKIPVSVGMDADTRLHLVLVAHGASRSCYNKFGGSGSMMVNNSLVGFEKHIIPFAIGELEPEKTFVHVLDDTTLDILLRTRDTITDFTEYLTKREKFLRSGIIIFSPGEEELLAHYLREINDEGEHDFVLPQGEELTGVSMEEGSWTNYQSHPQRLSQIEANRISYLWDDLIERFSIHAINGTQYHVSDGGFLDSERAIRMLALENRFTRRILADSLMELILKTPKDRRMIRVMPMHNDVHYVYLLLPYRSEFMSNYDEYRSARGSYLEITCYVVRLMYPEAKHVVGVAMESGIRPENFSEDLLYFDCSGWNDELEKQTIKDQKQFGILVAPNRFERTNKEYPD